MASAKPPVPTPVYRLVYVDNLETILARGALHSPNTKPNDGLPYRTIHDASVQESRHLKAIPCGPGGMLHDYVPFYFGTHSVMLLKLKTGRVLGYNEGQEPLVYLVTTMQDVIASGAGWVFTDGHGLATFTSWYDDPAKLTEVDWSLVKERYWSDTSQDGDRQRRKQAEFLVHDLLDWNTVRGIMVFNAAAKLRVAAILDKYPNRRRPPVAEKPGWYY
jgi:hypothetical protein